MKNSIFKSYSKKILRSEAFISVIVVFVLAIGIIGTSYALYMDVDTDTDYQLVEVGDLKIDFDNIDNSTNPEDYSKITLTNMVPMEDEIGVKQTDNIFSFRIYNTGTYTVDYDIKLVTADGNLVDSKYINFQLCKDDATNCSDVLTLSDIKDSIIREDHISPAKESEDASVYYFMRIWINNQYPLDTKENTNIVLRVLIEAENANGYLDNTNTLAGAILNNDKIKINNTTPNIKNTSTSEEGIYKTQDNYGTSYYFRGVQSNNYVELNNMCFRVVRIEGDASVKLTLAAEKKCSEITDSDKTSAFIGTGDYDYTDSNSVTSIKYKLDEWFTKNLSSVSSKIKKTTICTGDVTTKYNNSGEITTDNSYYYNSYIRLNNKDNATLKCDGETTSETQILPLTVDEIIFAGGKIGTTNSSYYLNDNANGDWWTITPSYFDGTNDNIFVVGTNGDINYKVNNEINNIRPTISLIPGTLISSGVGTKIDPYIIK